MVVHWSVRDGLSRRADEWHRLGAPVDLLSRDEAADKIGSDVCHGGLLDRLDVFDGVVVFPGAEAGPQCAAGPTGGSTGGGRRRVQDRLALPAAQGRFVGVRRVQPQATLLLPVGRK